MRVPRTFTTNYTRTFTTGQLARAFHVAPRTVSKWIDSGELPGYRIPGSNDRRVSAASAREFAVRCGMPMPPMLLDAGILILSTDPRLGVAVQLECQQTLVMRVENVFDLSKNMLQREWLVFIVDQVGLSSDGFHGAITGINTEPEQAGRIVAILNEDQQPSEYTSLKVAQTYQRPIDYGKLAGAVKQLAETPRKRKHKARSEQTT